MANKIVTDYIALLKYQIDEAGKKRFDNAVSDSKRRVDALAVSLKTVGEAHEKYGLANGFRDECTVWAPSCVENRFFKWRGCGPPVPGIGHSRISRRDSQDRRFVKARLN